MSELVKLYKNLRDLDLGHMLYKTKEGLQKEAFDYCEYYLKRSVFIWLLMGLRLRLW